MPTLLQGIFLTAIPIMIAGILAPAFYTSDKKTDKLLSRFVIPVENNKDDTLAYVVSHIEHLLKKPDISPHNITLVASGKGLQLFNTDSRYQTRLQTLLAKGVRMYADETAMSNTNQIFDGVKRVSNGKQYVEELMDQGYINSIA